MTQVLLVAHELEFSGASLALLDLGKSLRRLGLEVSISALQEGPLGGTFASHGIPANAAGPLGDLKCVVANTVISMKRAAAFRQFGVPVVLWTHETLEMIDWFRSNGFLPDPAMLREINLIVCPARFQLTSLVGFFAPSPCAQLRNVVAVPVASPHTQDGTVAVSGTWEQRKGQSTLLHLLEDENLADVTLKFVGADREKAEVECGKSMTDRHIFTGRVSREEANNHVALSSIFLSASRYEVQPLAVIEALMLGKRVLLTDIPAHREVADGLDGVAFFSLTEPSSIAAGLAFLQAADADEETLRLSRSALFTRFGQDAFDDRVRSIFGSFVGIKGDNGDIPQFQP